MNTHIHKKVFTVALIAALFTGTGSMALAAQNSTNPLLEFTSSNTASSGKLLNNSTVNGQTKVFVAGTASSTVSSVAYYVDQTPSAANSANAKSTVSPFAIILKLPSTAGTHRLLARIMYADGRSYDTSATFKTAAAANAGKILFQDDFNGTAIDTTKWEDYCKHGPPAFFGNNNCGAQTVDGKGHLVVAATPTVGHGVMTKSKFQFEYGTMSAWIKLPQQAGYWPAFWSVNDSANVPAGTNKETVGEIDAMEGYTTWDNIIHAAVHSWSSNPEWGTGPGGCDEARAPNFYSSSFHKFSAKVAPDAVTFYIDDVQCGKTITNKSADAVGKPWPFGPDVTRGNWMILDLAVGGAGGQQKTPTVPAQMLVDRVEVRAN